jgi:hypothetical protein
MIPLTGPGSKLPQLKLDGCPAASATSSATLATTTISTFLRMSIAAFSHSPPERRYVLQNSLIRIALFEPISRAVTPER